MSKLSVKVVGKVDSSTLRRTGLAIKVSRSRSIHSGSTLAHALVSAMAKVASK